MIKFHCFIIDLKVIVIDLLKDQFSFIVLNKLHRYEVVRPIFFQHNNKTTLDLLSLKRILVAWVCFLLSEPSQQPWIAFSQEILVSIW